ncbi:MAG TPA: histidine kinase, partial [Bacteroidales bacterium]|nr:histidine kinase [Bacteroidales bacterium]
DAGWSKPVREGHFRYRNLPPGKYILKAKSWDGLNTPGQEVSLLEVEVEPAYWQTIWFQVVIMVVIIFIVALIVRQIQRVRYMNRIALLEAADSVNRERLRIARDMHDDIGAGLTRISMLSRFINRDRVADEKITLKLNEVGEIADHLVDEMGEIIWAMNPKNDSLPLFVA